MSSCIGILREYAVGGDWEDYTDHLEQYFVTNKMDTNEDAERRRAVLLTVCVAPTYSPIKDLLAPAKPSDKSYEELINLVKRHYHPKPEIGSRDINFIPTIVKMVSQHPSSWLIYADSPNIVSLQINSKRCHVISL